MSTAFLAQGLPSAAASPQVQIVLHEGQVTLSSNIAPGPQAWETIRQVCYAGLLAAHEQALRATLEGGQPRLIAVPTLDVQRAMDHSLK